ncbi:MAG: hypothetical protein C0507_09755 [Cyanobacteria bacterium PR.3.49]|nr:hypothetical protein [Cyanobacteria bacterium PR.3.49]
MEALFIIKALVIGLLTGLMSGCFGVGGGIICTPLVRIFLHIDPHVAVGTTMALIIPTSIAGAYNYWRRKQVDRAMSLKLAPLAILGTISGAALTQYVEGQVLMLLFALLVCIAGIDLSFSIGENIKKKKEGETGSDGHFDSKIESDSRNDSNSSNETRSEIAAPAAALAPFGIGPYLVGLAAGLFAGFFGVGGGFLMVPCLLYFFRFGVKAAFGTSLIVIAIISIPGTLSHFALKHVNLFLAALMIAGSIPGSLAGSALALKLKDTFLRKGFGVIMLIMSVVLALRELLPQTPF